MIPFLGLAKLFSNPLTKYLGEKAIGYFEHKSEMLKNERIAEIELSKSVQIQQIKSSEKILERRIFNYCIYLYFSCTLYTSSYAIYGSRMATT
jgi:hypothetical protein